MKQREKSNYSSHCEQLTQFFEVFYRKMPTSITVFMEELKIWESLVARKTNPKQTIGIQVAMIEELMDVSHADIIKSYLRYGALSIPPRISISNYPNQYVKEALEENPLDLIVIFLLDEEDVEWRSPDKQGQAGGKPTAVYSREEYGEPPFKFKNEPDLRQVPPDRIIGFYYI